MHKHERRVLASRNIGNAGANRPPVLDISGLPLFTVVPHNVPWHHAALQPTAQLTQWNGSFVDHTGATITYTMVGTDPSSTNVTTTVPAVIVPVKMVYGIANGNMTFDPTKAKVSNGPQKAASFRNAWGQ